MLKIRNSEEFGSLFILQNMTKKEREKDKNSMEKLKSEREGEIWQVGDKKQGGTLPGF